MKQAGNGRPTPTSRPLCSGLASPCFRLPDGKYLPAPGLNNTGPLRCCVLQQQPHFLWLTTLMSWRFPGQEVGEKRERRNTWRGQRTPMWSGDYPWKPSVRSPLPLLFTGNPCFSLTCHACSSQWCGCQQQTMALVTDHISWSLLQTHINGKMYPQEKKKKGKRMPERWKGSVLSV